MHNNTRWEQIQVAAPRAAPPRAADAGQQRAPMVALPSVETPRAASPPTEKAVDATPAAPTTAKGTAKRTIRTLNLLYHIWPVASNDLWRWNVTQLLERIDLFNGKRVVAIVSDHETVPVAEVRREFANCGAKFIERANDPRMREAKTFLELLDEVQTLDPSQATFYAHAKGVSRAPDIHAVEKMWAGCLYHYCLDYPDRMREALCHKAMYGVSFPMEKVYIYPGTFWWFHNASLFSKPNWRTIENTASREGVGWAVESFPNRFFADDCERVYPDLRYPTDIKTGLYDPRIWNADAPKRPLTLSQQARWRWENLAENHGLTWGKRLSGDSVVAAAGKHATLDGARILEIGPGYGRFIESLDRQGVPYASYTAIDLSLFRTRELAGTFPQSRIVQGDVESARDMRGLGQFDVIVATLVFKRLCPTFQLAAVNCAAVLAPGGKLLFDVPETGIDWAATVKAEQGFFESERGAFAKSYRREEVKEILKASGFGKVRFDAIEHDLGKRRLWVSAEKEVLG